MVRFMNVRRLHRLGAVAAMAALLVFGAPKPAFAYIDPGTGAMLLQLLLGGIAGGLVILKLYWHRLKERTTRLFGVRNEEQPKAD